MSLYYEHDELRADRDRLQRERDELQEAFDYLLTVLTDVVTASCARSATIRAGL